MGATVHKLGRKYQPNEWMYLQSIKSVEHNAAMSINRSILKKSRPIGIGLLQCNLSTVKTHKKLYGIACSGQISAEID